MSYISFVKYWMQAANFHHHGLSWKTAKFMRSKLTE